MKLGIENRKELMAAAGLVVVLAAILAYQFMPSSSTIASTTPATTALPASAGAARPATRRSPAAAAGKRERAPQSLDPTLHLDQLASSERIKYEGTGRNIFVAQADTEIPKVIGSATTDHNKKDTVIQIQPPPPPPPIPLKFFGFASKPGEPKRVFLIKGDDVFVAGEGETVDRRYKVVRISPTTVEIQDVVGSGPPQSIPLTQG